MTFHLIVLENFSHPVPENLHSAAVRSISILFLLLTQNRHSFIKSIRFSFPPFIHKNTISGFFSFSVIISPEYP